MLSSNKAVIKLLNEMGLDSGQQFQLLDLLEQETNNTKKQVVPPDTLPFSNNKTIPLTAPASNETDVVELIEPTILLEPAEEQHTIELSALLKDPSYSEHTRPLTAGPISPDAPTRMRMAPLNEDDYSINPADRYTFIEQIGIGGMGVVHRVYDRYYQRIIALKKLKAEWLKQPSMVEQFQREPRLIYSFYHPGIIPVLDVGTYDDGSPYFTMPIIQGETLRSALKTLYREIRSDHLDGVRTLLSRFVRCCEAIAFAHEQGLIHRDLKPSNIMLGEYGETYVVDWGLAERLPAKHRIQNLPLDGGTPTYLAPELLDGGKLDHIATEIYSLGATLYKILCGQTPYHDESYDKIISGGYRVPPKTLWRWQADGLPIDDDLITICNKAMDRNPKLRHHNVMELIDEINGWLSGSARRKEAVTIISEAKSVFPSITRKQAKAKDLKRKAQRELGSIPVYAGSHLKSAGWNLLAESETLEEDAKFDEDHYERLLYGALSFDPHLEEAHLLLAKLYRERLIEAERNWNRFQARTAKLHLEAHILMLTDGEEKEQLLTIARGDGQLNLEILPAPDSVLLETYNQQLRKWPLFNGKELDCGSCQSMKLTETIAKGSYRLTILREGSPTLYLPLSVQRNELVKGTIHLLHAKALDEEECLVPAGWYWSGSQTDHMSSLPLRQVFVPDFIIQRYPVTNLQYIDFLNALVNQGFKDLALSYAPRERNAALDSDIGVIYGFNGKEFYLKADNEGVFWHQDWPVVLIDYSSAQAYAEWYSKRSNQHWRLPFELEREKATRGADGREFPWGNFYDPSWSNTSESLEGLPQLCSVYEFETDCSPYGVCGLAGNVYDWCADRFRLDGPRLDQRRFTPTTEKAGIRTISGASWASRPIIANAWYRDSQRADVRSSVIGFRLARSVNDSDYHKGNE